MPNLARCDLHGDVVDGAHRPEGLGDALGVHGQGGIHEDPAVVRRVAGTDHVVSGGSGTCTSSARASKPSVYQ
ncbi:hypothetical protein NPS01_40070 [Nocardioides psychrotolerans]|nr:hypothetical protein NPS01_40070 [Nocardioides psychrotolerans]